MSNRALTQNRRRRDLTFAGACAVFLILALAATGAARWPEATFICVILTAALVVYHRGAPDAPAAPAPLPTETERAAIAARLGVGRVAAGTEPTPYDDLVNFANSLPDPFLAVDAQSLGEAMIANDSAREVLGAGEDRKLYSLLRRPELADAIRQTLNERSARTIPLHLIGAVERFLTAHAAPFTFRGRLFVAVLIRDETFAIKAERMRGDFFANASHELKTPLASLSGFIQTLRGHARDDPAAQQRFLAIMESQAERMSRLIADLLSLSKIELNEHVPPREISDVRAAAMEAAAGLDLSAQRRNVALRLDLGEHPAFVRANAEELVQIAQNLVDNAIKYSPAGGTVRIRLGAFSDRDAAAQWAYRQWPEAARAMIAAPGAGAEGAFVALRVEDSGPGIEREHLARLSERFYRVPPEAIWRDRPDPAQNEAEKILRRGTGLGLAIVKHIVNRSKGGFAAESRRGQGSAFAAFFPVADRNAEPFSAELRAEDYHDAPPPARGAPS